MGKGFRQAQARMKLHKNLKAFQVLKNAYTQTQRHHTEYKLEGDANGSVFKGLCILSEA